MNGLEYEGVVERVVDCVAGGVRNVGVLTLGDGDCTEAAISNALASVGRSTWTTSTVRPSHLMVRTDFSGGTPTTMLEAIDVI